MRLYDFHESWRKREHLILKRMNEHNFLRNEAPSILLNFRVYKQCQKAKKLYRKSFTYTAPEVYEWKHVTKRARYRLPDKYLEQNNKPDDSWSLNIKANKLKINTMHIRSDWTQCIFSSLDKV